MIGANEGGIMVHNGSDLCFVSYVKDKQGLDPILIELRVVMLKKSIEAFSLGEVVCFDIKVIAVFPMLIT